MDRKDCQHDPEHAALLIKIQEWLDHPQTHLDDKSRRKVLELVVSDHVEKVRRAERTRARAKDLVLFAAVLTIVGTYGPRILAVLGFGIE